jgi:hypothetical protein
MIRINCSKHDSHHIWGCVHVEEALESGSAMPILGEPNTSYLVCINCLTPTVRQLLLGLEEVNFFPFLDQLKQQIGFCPLCTECLYENTGIDRRAT